MKKILLATAAIGITTIGAQAQNLIQNGSFESGNFSQNTFFPDRMSLPNNNSTVLANWVTGVGSGYLWWLTTPGFNPQEGNFAIDLDSNLATDPNSYVEQSFATTIGAQYAVSGYFSSEFNGGPATCNLLINGSLIGAVTSGTGSPDTSSLTFNNLVWQNATFTFTATSTTSTLRLQDGAENGYYNSVIDNISVVAVPEPSVSAICAAGVLGIVWSSRKRSRLGKELVRLN